MWEFVGLRFSGFDLGVCFCLGGEGGEGVDFFVFLWLVGWLVFSPVRKAPPSQFCVHCLHSDSVWILISHDVLFSWKSVAQLHLECWQKKLYYEWKYFVLWHLRGLFFFIKHDFSLVWHILTNSSLHTYKTGNTICFCAPGFSPNEEK